MSTGQLATRARQILERVPDIEKTTAIRASFELPINTRPPLSSLRSDQISCAHGTNLTVAIQALRNANGQLAPPTRLAELGIEQRTGECLDRAGSPVQGPPFLAVGLLRAGLGMAMRYARIESGHADHFWGPPARDVLSEADTIPVIAIGELVDPEGKARAAHEAIYVNDPFWAENLPEENEMHGWSPERVGAQMKYMQLLGERLNIRLILTFDPEANGRDLEYQGLIREVIDQISDEQERDFSDIPVHLPGDVPQSARQDILDSREIIIHPSDVMALIAAR